MDIDVPAAYETHRDAMLEELRASLAKVRDPSQAFSHYLGAEGLAARIEHLENFVL